MTNYLPLDNRLTETITDRVQEFIDRINTTYRVEDGTVRSPGKFEGEPIATIYLYECILDGDGQPEDDGTTTIRLHQVEADMLNVGHLVNDYGELGIFESEQGFVYLVSAAQHTVDN